MTAHYGHDAERGCGCLVLVGLTCLVFWIAVLITLGPIAAIGILLIEIALFGFAVDGGPTS